MSGLLIAEQGRGDYRTPVAAFLVRSMTLLALLLMPLGMSARPAAAAEAMPAHHAMMPSGEGHHDDGPANEPAGRSAECAMACSMLAPDATGAIVPVEVRAQPVASRATVQRAGLHPEMEPPPPKLS